MARAAGDLRVGVLVSGEGTTAAALAAALVGAKAPARVVVVIADRPGIPALDRAAAAGIPTRVVAPTPGGDESWGARLTEALDAYRAGFVVLAGFLRRLPPVFIERWTGRVINVHPSLLPRWGGPGMYGTRVHAAVLAAGDAESGVTVHAVTNDVDAGPILWQERVRVRRGMTPAQLREAVRPLEVRGLVETVRRVAAGEPPSGD